MFLNCDIFLTLGRSLYYTFGGRLLSSILICSSLETLVTTGVQQYIEYRRNVQNTENIVQYTCKSHLRAVAENLWLPFLDPDCPGHPFDVFTPGNGMSQCVQSRDRTESAVEHDHISPGGIVGEASSAMG